MKKHQKHTALVRPLLGQFGRREFALLGAPCGIIQDLAQQIITRFAAAQNIAYADADHTSFDNPRQTAPLAAGAFAAFTDHNVFERFDYAEKSDKFLRNRRFAEADWVLINGNHFAGSRQIVLLHPKKAESLHRKREQLTDVALILTTEGAETVPAWLRADLAERAVPTFSLSDTEKIFVFLEQEFAANRPPLYGLVLAGGKSRRMGHDKGAIDYHGKPQRTYVYEMLTQMCEKTYLSGRPEQTLEWQDDFAVLPDTFTGLGPFGAILSAFRKNPNAAWLCVACDLPLLTQNALRSLIDARDTRRIATAFHNAETDFPEPLITIWEPKSYSALLQFLSQGYSCPRKVLINSAVKIIKPQDEKVLTNVNTEAERARLQDKP